MKHTGGISVNVVITGSGPVTIAIDQCHIGRKKPQGSIDIEDPIKFFLQLICGCLIEQFAQRNQVTP